MLPRRRHWQAYPYIEPRQNFCKAGEIFVTYLTLFSALMTLLASASPEYNTPYLHVGVLRTCLCDAGAGCLREMSEPSSLADGHEWYPGPLPHRNSYCRLVDGQGMNPGPQSRPSAAIAWRSCGRCCGRCSEASKQTFSKSAVLFCLTECPGYVHLNKFYLRFTGPAATKGSK